MTANPNRLETRPYDLAEFGHLDITTDALVAALGYRLMRLELKFANIHLVDVSQLEQEFQDLLPYIDLSTERAKRETLVSRLVKFLVRQTQCQLRYDYNLRSTRLYGTVDYWLQQRNVFVVVVAPGGALTKGCNQLAATLIALDQSGTVSAEQPTLLGCVTTGTVWQLGALDRRQEALLLDRKTYQIPAELSAFLPILATSLSLRKVP